MWLHGNATVHDARSIVAHVCKQRTWAHDDIVTQWLHYILHMMIMMDTAQIDTARATVSQGFLMTSYLL